jgi:SAM-dependent methyltransferase
MTDWRQRTVDTYDQSAVELAEYFKGIGPRVEDIRLAFDLAGNPKDARVVEIGCGDGRDAIEILKYAEHYLGFDISKKLIDIAKDKAPSGKFVVADATEFVFEDELDIVFAFASLLHLNKKEVKSVCAKVCAALKEGGVFYISVKSAPRYHQEIKKDKYGERLFYFYNDDLMKGLVGDGFVVSKLWHKMVGSTDWLEIILKKAIR